MSDLVLDAGVWIASRDADDPFHEECRGLVGSGAAVGALDLTLYEVANVATRRWQSPGDARRLVELVIRACEERLHRVDTELVTLAVQTAAKHSISVYDAAYVACADRLGARLVSTDLRDLVNRGLAVVPADA